MIKVILTSHLVQARVSLLYMKTSSALLLSSDKPQPSGRAQISSADVELCLCVAPQLRLHSKFAGTAYTSFRKYNSAQMETSNPQKGVRL